MEACRESIGRAFVGMDSKNLESGCCPSSSHNPTYRFRRPAATPEGQVIMTPLTVAEARAILLADKALVLSLEERGASGLVFGIEERDAWIRLVESANDRIAIYERPSSALTQPRDKA